MSTLIPPGRYAARATDADLGLSKQNTEQIGIGFEILQEGEFCGWHITGFFSFSDKAAEYTFEKMRNAGWTGDDVGDLTSLAPSTVDCSITIKHEEWEGETNAKVAFVNKPSDGKVKMAAPLDGGQRQSFAARMRAKAIASRPREQSAPPSRPVNGGATPTRGRDPHPNAPGNNEDDIPF